MQPPKPLVIYHGQCRDGFGAAWAIWRKFPGFEYYGANFGQPPPDVTGRSVIMVDFSYPRAVMDKLANDAVHIQLLDHHKTAMDDLTGWGPSNVVSMFDMGRSGAGMAWDFFWKGNPRPWLIDYVEDRDLWTNKLPNTAAVNAYISTLRYDFEDWYQASKQSLDEVIPAGRAVENKIRQYVVEVAKNHRRVDFEGHNVPIVNAPQVDISELVGFLASGETFAMGWWQRSDGKFVYSLRSKDGFNVSELAKKYGGGGHPAAAGFQVPSLVV